MLVYVFNQSMSLHPARGVGVQPDNALCGRAGAQHYIWWSSFSAEANGMHGEQGTREAGVGSQGGPSKAKASWCGAGARD